MLSALLVYMQASQKLTVAHQCDTSLPLDRGTTNMIMRQYIHANAVLSNFAVSSAERKCCCQEPRVYNKVVEQLRHIFPYFPRTSATVSCKKGTHASHVCFTSSASNCNRCARASHVTSTQGQPWTKHRVWQEKFTPILLPYSSLPSSQPTYSHYLQSPPRNLPTILFPND